jgi:hypothetical protein
MLGRAWIDGERAGGRAITICRMDAIHSEMDRESLDLRLGGRCHLFQRNCGPLGAQGFWLCRHLVHCQHKHRAW